jgi:dienelactone hydrolase
MSASSSYDSAVAITRRGQRRLGSGFIALAVLAAGCSSSDPGTGAGEPTTRPSAQTDEPDAGPSTPADAALTGLDAEPVDPTVFDYDPAYDLNFVENPEALAWPDADIHEFEYDSPLGGRVTGLVAHPPEDDSDAAVLFIHGMPEGARDYMQPLAGFSCAGATALVINAPYVRDGRSDEPYTWTELDRDEQIQAVVDLRRAVDVLETMGVERITVDGTSWGAGIGALLAGVEPRVDGYALMVGGALVDRFIKDGEPTFPLDQQPDDVVAEWLELMGSVDPTHFVGDATAPILFQNGSNDTTVPPEAVEALHTAAGPDHEVRWYDSGHEPTLKMLAEHIQWQADILGLDADLVDGCFETLLQE